MHYTITIPSALPAMTVKEALEDYFLIPRKIRHFLRTKKHVQVQWGDSSIGNPYLRLVTN